jgi:putative hydrolase of the HAD superfamily
MAVSTPVAFPGGLPEAVTFDYWDTLVCVGVSGARDARRHALAAVLGELAGEGKLASAGIASGAGDATFDERLDDALDGAFGAYTNAWHANRQFTGEDGALFVLGALGVDLAPADAQRVVTAYVRSAAGLAPKLTPGVAATLRTLANAGVRLGIVCDVGMTPSDILRDYLDGHGLLGLFHHWSFSDEVGVYKPDPAIFRHALDGLGGVDPGRAAHVGDLRRTDVAGARAVGLATVRYAGRNDDRATPPEGGPEAGAGVVAPDADVVIHHHDELPAALGLTP